MPMDKNAVPSKAMVVNLLKHNGYGPRLATYLVDYPLYIALPYMDKQAGAEIVKKFVKPEELEQAYQQIYAQHLTADEVLTLIAFYKSPVGKKLVQHDEEIRRHLERAAMEKAASIAIDIIKETNRKQHEDDGLENGLEIP